MQPLEQQDSEQGCPNLDTQSVFTGPYKALHFEILLERFEEEFDLPAVLDLRDT